MQGSLPSATPKKGVSTAGKLVVFFSSTPLFPHRFVLQSLIRTKKGISSLTASFEESFSRLSQRDQARRDGEDSSLFFFSSLRPRDAVDLRPLLQL